MIPKFVSVSLLTLAAFCSSTIGFAQQVRIPPTLHLDVEDMSQSEIAEAIDDHLQQMSDLEHLFRIHRANLPAGPFEISCVAPTTRNLSRRDEDVPLGDVLPQETAAFIEVDSIAGAWTGAEDYWRRNGLVRQTEITPLPSGFFAMGGVGGSGNSKPKPKVPWPLQCNGETKTEYQLDSAFFTSAGITAVEDDLQSKETLLKLLDRPAFYAIARSGKSFATIVGIQVDDQGDQFEKLLTFTADKKPISIKAKTYNDVEVTCVGDSAGYFFNFNRWLYLASTETSAQELIDNLQAYESGKTADTLRHNRLFRRLVPDSHQKADVFVYVDVKLSQDYIDAEWARRFPREDYYYQQVKTAVYDPSQLGVTVSVELSKSTESAMEATMNRAFAVPIEDSSTLFLQNPKPIKEEIPFDFIGNSRSVVILADTGRDSPISSSSFVSNYSSQPGPGISFNVVSDDGLWASGNAWPRSVESRWDRIVKKRVLQEQEDNGAFAKEDLGWRLWVSGHKAATDHWRQSIDSQAPSPFDLQLISDRISKPDPRGVLVFAEATFQFGNCYSYLVWRDRLPWSGLLGFPPSQTMEAIPEKVYFLNKRGERYFKPNRTGIIPDKEYLSGIPSDELSWFNDFIFRLKFSLMSHAMVDGIYSQTALYAFGYSKPSTGILTVDLLQQQKN